MEGQTGEAWEHPKRSDVLLDNGKHTQKRKYIVCFMQASKC
jgi:hypothetical protein